MREDVFFGRLLEPMEQGYTLDLDSTVSELLQEEIAFTETRHLS